MLHRACYVYSIAVQEVHNLCECLCPNSSAHHVLQVEQAIRGILAIVDPVAASSATVAASGTYNMTLVSYALQVNSSVATDISLHVLEEVFVGSLTLGGLEAMLSTARSIAILDRGEYM